VFLPSIGTYKYRDRRFESRYRQKFHIPPYECTCLTLVVHSRRIPAGCPINDLVNLFSRETTMRVRLQLQVEGKEGKEGGRVRRGREEERQKQA
jgi:hypothetical protein